ncbi:MAG: hypothetical protein ACYCQI_05405 [Gammaproteobacteria bacterium]
MSGSRISRTLHNLFSQQRMRGPQLTDLNKPASPSLLQALKEHENAYGDPATVAKQTQIDAKMNPDHWQTAEIGELLTGTNKCGNKIGRVWLQSVSKVESGLTALTSLDAHELRDFLKRPLPPGKSRFYSCISAFKNGYINVGDEHFHHKTQVAAHPEHGYRENLAIMSMNPEKLPSYLLKAKVAVSIVENNSHAGSGKATQIMVAQHWLPFIDAQATAIIIQNAKEHALLRRNGLHWSVAKSSETASDHVMIGHADGRAPEVVNANHKRRFR